MDSNKRISIMVGVNTLTAIDQSAYSNHCQFWFRLGRNYPNIQFGLHNPRRSSIDRMRNHTAKLAISSGFDYVMFLDDDVLVPPHDSLQKMVDADKDVVAAHTIIRGHPFHNMFFKDNEKKDGLSYYDDPPEGVDLVECAAVGFSFVLIKTSLLEKVPPPYFVTGMHNTEDVYFCLKAKHHVPDCSIFVDMSIPTGHILGSEIMAPDNRKAYKEYYEIAFPNNIDNPEGHGDRGESYLKSIGETV